MLIERLRDFYTNPGKIPSLAYVLFGRRATPSDSDRRPRQMRSERREACCSLLGAIAHYCDLPSLCLSVPQTGGSLLPIRMDTLAQAAGLTLRRAERAMRDIIDAGLLGVHPRCERQDDGCYIGRAAIRVVPVALFGLFGLEARLEHERRRISETRREREPTRTEKARFKTTIQSALGALMGRSQPASPAAATLTPPQIEIPDLLPHETVREQHIRIMRGILGGDPPAPRSGGEPASPTESDSFDRNHDPP